MSEFCQNCECYYDTVFRVPTGVWEKLTGHADGGGLLCPACCDLLARRAGLELYWEATVGEYPVAAEREAVAEMADRSVEKWKQLMAEGGITDMSLATIRARIREAQTLATAIRARGIIADGEVGEAHA